MLTADFAESHVKKRVKNGGSFPSVTMNIEVSRDIFSRRKSCSRNSWQESQIHIQGTKLFLYGTIKRWYMHASKKHILFYTSPIFRACDLIFVSTFCPIQTKMSE